MPNLGKSCQFSHVRLQNIRQIAVRGFRKYLIFYQVTIAGVEIIRVLHGSRDMMSILGTDYDEDN
ncbi:type II toxin-antitoxin system RelE/ParE family toxin [Spirulina major]|uniref:type II toxin-antitoxin system RelE/ParE family toxin n=1 Tax=Spirulina major TaxID=270636 RepID=UPI0031830163